MKKIVCIALAACFVVALVSFSSSASAVNAVTPVDITSVFLTDINNGSYHYLTRTGDTFSFTKDLGIFDPSACFSSLQFYFGGLSYQLPSYSGRPVSLSFNIDFDVIGSRYLDLAPSGNDIIYSCIFNSANIYVHFTEGSSAQLAYDTFLLRDDDTGEVLNFNSPDYWNMAKGGNFDFDISVLFDITPYLGKTVDYVTVFFPNYSGRIYYSNHDLTDYLVIDDINANFDFIYTPFNDVVQDDLTDIKTQLGTIDQDVNRVQQDVSDLKDTIEDFQQDLTSSDFSISSDISDKEDIINSIKDAMENDNSFLDNALNDMIVGFPDAEDPFHDAPSPHNFFAVDFIQQLWSFIKAQTVFFDFIFLGLCFCLATFILRR